MNNLILFFVGVLLISLSFEDIEDMIQQATIAGVTVPAVSCEEDEVITWIGPDRLGCVHYEEVK